MPCCIKFKHALQTILYVYLFCSLRRWNQVVLKSYHVKIQGTCWVEWLRRTLRKPGPTKECRGMPENAWEHSLNARELGKNAWRKLR